MMGIFDGLGRQPQQQQNDAMQHDVESIKANPGTFLKGRGFSIPEGMTDVRQITQYLLQSGQISPGRLQQTLRGIGFKR